MILARAPLRISLGGGRTDLPSYYNKYGGFILSGTNDKYLYIHVNRPAVDDLNRIFWPGFGGRGENTNMRG